jgi:outer membrane protein insertion porin family
MMYLLLLVLSILSAFAVTDFNLQDVVVTCPESVACDQRTARFKSLIGEYRSLVHLKDTLRVLASDGGYQSFTYELNEVDKVYSLNINFKLKPIISQINIGFTDRNIEYDPLQLITIREGDFFETQKLRDSMFGLETKLESMGFPNNSHSYEVIEKNNQVSVNIVVTVGKPRIFKNIKSDSKSSYVRGYLRRKFLNLYNKPFDVNRFKVYLDDAQKELFSYGYYLIGLDFHPTIKGNRVILDIKVINEQLFAFDLKNLKQEQRDVVHNLLVDLFRKYKKAPSDLTIRNALKEHYELKALLNASIKIEPFEFINNQKEVVHLYRIFFNEHEKTRMEDVKFFGNSFFKTSRLERMYKTEAFELASLSYYDEEYLAYFQDFLKTQYIQKGFVQIRIPDPLKTFDQDKKIASVEFTIQEGTRAFVREINFEGLEPELEEKVLSKISNKVGNAFNPISLVEDTKAVTTLLQEEGYYYAEILNASDAELVRYSKSGSDVDIRFKVETGPVIKMNRALFLGNDKTKKRVLAKKVFLKKGEIITPSKTREIESSLSATGLFNSVAVAPLRHNSKNATTDLLIKVTERDYGLIEIAPGYRTDLGIKLTGTIAYQNIGGYNRAVTLQSQFNQRLDFMTLDPERRKAKIHILEHNTSLTYNQGDIFDTLIDGAASIAYQTRRFYHFDADIFRINGTLTRALTKKLSTSLTYQYEDIYQYNGATTDSTGEPTQYNGQFKIGAITPSFTYDLRNSQINPLKGAYFNISTEFANPYFLSQHETNQTVNYYKLLSRNRFYIPFKNGTLAISMVGGIQENLAKNEVIVDGVTKTEGSIPPIKVFRLSGMDIIRGFSDEEMNALPNGQDISSVRIENKAYLANFKLEPRYFINDSFMAGVFYDAGRVFVDHFDLSDLRDSVGVTFKVVTPVGTLDFDYGIKLLRKKTANGSLETPGRFHVSIGFF